MAFNERIRLQERIIATIIQDAAAALLGDNAALSKLFLQRHTAQTVDVMLVRGQQLQHEVDKADAAHWHRRQTLSGDVFEQRLERQG